MAIFNPIPYDYVSTAPRFKSKITHGPIQRQSSALDKAATNDDEGYRSKDREIDSGSNSNNDLEFPTIKEVQYTTLQKNVVSKDLILRNTTREDGIVLGKMDNSFLSLEKILLRQGMSMERLQDSRGIQDRPMVLEDDESYVSDLASASVLRLNKQIHATSHEA
ncbi:hypothetical protein SBOR_9206 [Sclerotinia borealis F-4128]|uniref:Uncharacterized protein n=1 Tax=Sclerotinia borealis (strain F-4128) TaxID=1432307 RepID=W9C3Z8_SCLBF|nr:hypothetical protein SBOR_9206 [Sclerotinia borealis F-4128]